jgi:hypothetical protein
MRDVLWIDLLQDVEDVIVKLDDLRDTASTDAQGVALFSAMQLAIHLRHWLRRGYEACHPTVNARPSRGLPS